MDKCDVKKEHRNEVLKHVPMERMWLLDYMAKQGLGVGATLRMENYNWGGSATVMFVDAEWITSLQPMVQRKVRYSKQALVVPQFVVERGTDGEIQRNQWNSIEVGGLIFQNGGSSKSTFMMSVSTLVNPTMAGRNITVVDPSHTPYEYDSELLCRNVKLHKRLMECEDPNDSAYDDLVYRQGIPPIIIR